MNELWESTKHAWASNDVRPARRSTIHRAAASLAIGIGAAVAAAGGTGSGMTDGVNTHVLTIRASGFMHARGSAVVRLFAAGDNVLGAGRWQLHAPIEGGAVVFRFRGLPAGTYAAVVFHDENDNGVIDHGLLGPSEPLGFSGGFVLSLLSGRPDFERLKFDFNPPAQLLDVTVR